MFHHRGYTIFQDYRYKTIGFIFQNNYNVTDENLLYIEINATTAKDITIYLTDRGSQMGLFNNYWLKTPPSFMY